MSYDLELLILTHPTLRRVRSKIAGYIGDMHPVSYAGDVLSHSTASLSATPYLLPALSVA